MFRLPSIDWLQNYNKQTFVRDISAGSIVAIVALPLTIAFAIASGVSPERGIITGVIASFLVAVFSGSRVQIAGPSGPFVVIAFGIVQQYGLNGLIVATFMAGVILIIMGKTNLGTLIKFIPYPVIAGFTTGVAVLLVTTEFKDLLGLHVGPLGSTLISKWVTYSQQLHTINPYAAVLAGATAVLMLAQTKFLRRVPGSLIALVVTTAAVQIFKLPVDTIGSRFENIASAIPAPVFPELSLQLLHDMVQPGLAIALLAAIEGLLAAVVADGLAGTTHEPNKVLIAHGIANIGSSLFGGLPACAAIARTATNVRNGASTPVGGITHAVLLLLILLVLGKWASLIPLASLAAVLTVVAYHLLDWQVFKALLKNPKSDVAVLLATLGLTLFVDLPTGVIVGMGLAGVAFIKRMAAVTDVNVITSEINRQGLPGASILPTIPLPKGVEIYMIKGPFFFGAVYKLREALRDSRKPKVRMIRMSEVNAMDSTGLHALEEVYHLCRKQNVAFLISEIHAQPYVALMKSGLLEVFGKENVLATFDEAIARTEELLRA